MKLRWFTLVLGWLAAAAGLSAELNMLPVIERNGVPHVAASYLAREQAIAIKDLPGRSEVAACHRDRCAVVRGAWKEGDETYVPVSALAEALQANPVFDDAKRNVRFEFAREPAPVPSPAQVGVGRLAPNFTLTRLDSSTISLDQLRGKRVLINSWASW